MSKIVDVAEWNRMFDALMESQEDCPVCKARRKKKAARMKRYRDKRKLNGSENSPPL